MEFVYVAYFVPGVYEDEVPHAFFTEKEAWEFCYKKNQEVVDKWNAKHGLAGFEEAQLTLEELLESGTDYWTCKKIKVGE